MVNEGNRAGTGFWYLGVPKRMRGRVSYESRPGNEQTLVAGDNWEVVGRFDQPEVPGFTDDFFLMKFVLTVALEPGVMMPCGTLLVLHGDRLPTRTTKGYEVQVSYGNTRTSDARARQIAKTLFGALKRLGQR